VQCQLSTTNIPTDRPHAAHKIAFKWCRNKLFSSILLDIMIGFCPEVISFLENRRMATLPSITIQTLEYDIFSIRTSYRSSKKKKIFLMWTIFTKWFWFWK